MASTTEQPFSSHNLTIDQQNIARLVIVVTFLLIFIMAARTPLDSDMWWHLRAGEEIVRTGRLLYQDMFSFSRAGVHWVNVYWLAQVSEALMFRWLGYLGLSAWVAGFATLSMWLVFKQCEGPAFLKAVALLLGSVVASVVWSPRPQLISLVLMALVGYLLYLYKWRGIDRLWTLPLVFILWANVHGGYPLGLILIGAMIGGEILNHLLGIHTGSVLTWKQIFRLGGFGIACGFAVLINPNGLDLWRLPFLTVNMKMLQQYIPEWAAPDFHVLLEQSIVWLLLAIFAAVGLSGRRMDGTDLLTVLGFAYMALIARRNFGPFALAAVPVLTRYAAAALQTWVEQSPWPARLSGLFGGTRVDRPRVRAVKKVINLSLVVLLGLVALLKLYGVSHPALVEHYLAESEPAQASAWLVQHYPGARVFNEYDWGGYLQWALPGFRLFVDGRTDLFGDEIVGAWTKTVLGEPGWQDTFERYPADVVMLKTGRPLLAKLDEDGWRLVYQDSQAVIYARK